MGLVTRLPFSASISSVCQRRSRGHLSWCLRTRASILSKVMSSRKHWDVHPVSWEDRKKDRLWWSFFFWPDLKVAKLKTKCSTNGGLSPPTPVTWDCWQFPFWLRHQKLLKLKPMHQLGCFSGWRAAISVQFGQLGNTNVTQVAVWWPCSLLCDQLGCLVEQDVSWV